MKRILILVKSENDQRSIRVNEAIKNINNIDIKIDVLTQDQCCIYETENKAYIITSQWKKNVEEWDAFWNLCYHQDNLISTYRVMKEHGIFCMQDPDILNKCFCKNELIAIARKNDILVPDQIICYPHFNNDVVKKELGNFFIIKPPRGSNGASIRYTSNIRDSEVDQRNARVLFPGVMSEGPIIAQKFIENNHCDERYIFCHDHIVNAMIRHGNPEDFARRNNLHQGGQGEKYAWTNIEEDLCKKIMSCWSGLNYAGIDLIRTPDNKLYFIELNPSCGVKIMSVTGKNHYIDCLKYIISNI